MKVKLFNVPSFEEWNKEREFKQTIGIYICVIETYFDCGEGHDGEINEYIAAITDSVDTVYCYAERVFFERVKMKWSDNENLKEWYEKVAEELNKKWNEYIMKVYVDKD